MRKTVRTAIGVAALMSMAVVNSALAFDQGDWLVRFGASCANPKSDNHEIVSVESATSFTFNVSYMMTDNWAVES